jgi:hypothetical protein
VALVRHVSPGFAQGSVHASHRPLARAFGLVHDQERSRSEDHGPQLAVYLKLRGRAALSKWKRQSTNNSISRTAMIPDDTAVQRHGHGAWGQLASRGSRMANK